MKNKCRSLKDERRVDDIEDQLDELKQWLKLIQDTIEVNPHLKDFNNSKSNNS